MFWSAFSSTFCALFLKVLCRMRVLSTRRRITNGTCATTMANGPGPDASVVASTARPAIAHRRIVDRKERTHRGLDPISATARTRTDPSWIFINRALGAACPFACMAKQTWRREPAFATMAGLVRSAMSTFVCHMAASAHDPLHKSRAAVSLLL